MADQSSVSQDDVHQEDTKAAADKVLQALDVKVVGTLHRLFNKMDDDNSGSLGREEFTKFIKRTLKLNKLPPDFVLEEATIDFHTFVLALDKQGLLKDTGALLRGDTRKMIAKAATRSSLSGKINKLTSSRRHSRQKDSAAKKMKDCRLEAAKKLDSPGVQAGLLVLVVLDVLIVFGEIILSNTPCECCTWDKFEHGQTSCRNYYYPDLDPKKEINFTTFENKFMKQYCPNELTFDAKVPETSEALKLPAVTTGTGTTAAESHDQGHGDGHGGHHETFCKENKHIETLEHVFHWGSVGILIVLELQIVALMCLLLDKFFTKWELVLDLLIVTVSLVLDLVSGNIHDSALLQVTTYTVLAWRLIRIVHGAFVAAEGAIKKSAMHHAQTLRKLLGSIGNSKMLLEILQQKLASPPEPKAEKSNDNGELIEAIDLNFTPRATQLIQQILQEEKKIEALDERHSQLFESIDSVYTMVADQERRLQRDMDDLHHHLDHAKKEYGLKKQSTIKLGLEHRAASKEPRMPSHSNLDKFLDGSDEKQANDDK